MACAITASTARLSMRMPARIAKYVGELVQNDDCA